MPSLPRTMFCADAALPLTLIRPTERLILGSTCMHSGGRSSSTAAMIRWSPWMSGGKIELSSDLYSWCVSFVSLWPSGADSGRGLKTERTRQALVAFVYQTSASRMKAVEEVLRTSKRSRAEGNGPQRTSEQPNHDLQVLTAPNSDPPDNTASPLR